MAFLSMLRRCVLGALLLQLPAVTAAAQAPPSARPAADDSPDVLYRTGLAHFNSGQYAEAAAAFQKLVDQFGKEPSMQKEMEAVYYALGCSLYNVSDHAGAATAFQNFITNYPSAKLMDEVTFRLGSSQQALEQYDDALATYRRVISQWPNSSFAEDALYQTAMCLLAQDRTKDVLGALEDFLKSFPNSDLLPQARVYLARAYFESGKLAEALGQIEALPVTGRSLDHVVYANFLAIEIGDSAFDNTDYDMALRAYRRVRTKASLVRLESRIVQARESEMLELLRSKVAPEQLAARFRQERRVRNALAAAKDALAKLEGMPDYDAGLFHRIGRCFFAVDRFWEARVAFARVAEEATDEKVKEAGHFDLVLTLNRLRRFQDLIAEADRYLARYGENAALVANGRVPSVAFMRAEAFVNQEFFEEALPAMRALLHTYPEHPLRTRIEFYEALSLAMLEQFDESIAKLKAWLQRHPDDPARPEVEYWLPVAEFYAGQYREAMPLFERYAAANPMSVYAPEAEYRAALCLYALEDFGAAATRLAAWIEKYPTHTFHGEALVTAGDAFAAAGQLEEAKKAYLRVTPDDGAFQFLALQQAAKVFRALDTEENYRAMKDAFEAYIRLNPDSGNAVDAAYQAGWALRQIGRADEARRLYWTTIERYGDNRRWEGFGPMLDDLRKLYADDREGLDADAQAAETRARDGGRITLLARLVTARQRWDKRDALESAREISRRFQPDALDAETLAFMGQAYLKGGEREKGLAALEKLLADFPKSRYADVAYARQAEARLAAGDATHALDLADSAMARAYDPTLLMEATFTRAEAARALARCGEAAEGYNTVLANRVTPRPLKPLAMLGLAACLEAEGDFRKAIPYYQRVYVLYLAYPDAVAQAYLRSAAAFEQLKDREAAANTYREMLSVKALAGRPELEQARARLGGGPS